MAYFSKPSPSCAPSLTAHHVMVHEARQAAWPWPDELLASFSLSMATHGMSISRIGMQSDTRYALQQLHDARGMGDATLAQMADELLRCFEAQEPGRSALAH